MKKRIALLALALTLCSAFAAFPVSAHEAEAITETETVITESVKTEEKVIYLEERDLNKRLDLRRYVDGARRTMEFTTDSPVASIERNSIRIDKSILDQELYGDTPEVIVECMLGAYRGLPEKKMTLRFICEGYYSAGADTDRYESSGDTDDSCHIVPRDEGSYISKATLNSMASKEISIAGVSGITVKTTMSNSSISTQNTPGLCTKINADPNLSDRYNTDSDNLMTLNLPFLNSVSRTISVDLGNDNVTPLLGSNTIDMIAGSTTVGSGSRLYVYNISSDNAYEVLAKSS